MQLVVTITHDRHILRPVIKSISMKISTGLKTGDLSDITGHYVFRFCQSSNPPGRSRQRAKLPSCNAAISSRAILRKCSRSFSGTGSLAEGEKQEDANLLSENSRLTIQSSHINGWKIPRYIILVLFMVDFLRKIIIEHFAISSLHLKPHLIV